MNRFSDCIDVFRWQRSFAFADYPLLLLTFHYNTADERVRIWFTQNTIFYVHGIPFTCRRRP